MNVFIFVVIALAIYVAGVVTSPLARKFAVFAVTDVKADFEKEKAILQAEITGLETKARTISVEATTKLETVTATLSADKAKLAADLKAALDKVELLKSLFPTPAPVVDPIPNVNVTNASAGLPVTNQNAAVVQPASTT